MPVGMHHRLSGRLAAVQTDVETADGVIRQLQIFPSLLQEFTYVIPLGLMEFHSVGHIPNRNHQAVAFGDGLGIGDADRKFVSEQYPL